MFVHELGHLLFAKLARLRVEEFGFGYPPRLLTIGRVGGTEYTLNLILFGAFVRLAGDGEPFANKSTVSRVAFLLGGSFLNLLLSVSLFSVCFASGWPIAHDRAVAVNKVLPGSVAEAVGLQDNDLILAADGHRVASMLELVRYARSVHGNVREVHVLRRGRTLSLSLPAGGPWFTRPETRGVQVRDGAGWVEIVAFSWPEAGRRAVSEALSAVGALLILPIRILQGAIPVDMVRPVGPVGIAQLTGQAAQQVASSGWWFPLLQLTAVLSAALAGTNLMPLPGLDGGRLLFILVEALRGKRLDPRRESLVHLAGLVLLLALILIVTYYDITVPYPFGGR